MSPTTTDSPLHHIKAKLSKFSSLKNQLIWIHKAAAVVRIVGNEGSRCVMFRMKKTISGSAESILFFFNCPVKASGVQC